MRYGLFLTIAMFVAAWHLGCPAEEPDHIAKMKALAAGRSLESSPQARAYLKSLTKEQTLTALRQFGKRMEAELPIERWPELGLAVVVLMQFYDDEPTISPGELAKLPTRVRRNYEDGSVPGPLSDEAFDRLITGISDNKEGVFFRYALANYATVDDDVSPILSKAQKERLFDTYLSVVSDRQAPEVVRRECCDSAMRVVREDYRHIIYADEAVKELMRTGTPERRHNLYALLNSGEIKPTAKTIEQLAPWRRRVQDFRKTLVGLQEDEREPKSLKERTNMAIASLDALPQIPTVSSSNDRSN